MSSTVTMRAVPPNRIGEGPQIMRFSRADLASEDDVLAATDRQMEELAPASGAVQLTQSPVELRGLAARERRAREHPGLVKIIERRRRRRRVADRDAVHPVRHRRRTDQLHAMTVRQACRTERHILADVLTHQRGRVDANVDQIIVGHLHIVSCGAATLLHEETVRTIDEDVRDAGIVQPMLERLQQPSELALDGASRWIRHLVAPARISSR